jgi:hypothetical protein
MTSACPLNVERAVAVLIAFEDECRGKMGRLLKEACSVAALFDGADGPPRDRYMVLIANYKSCT